MRNILIAALGILLIFSSCKNDLDLNAEWKDITIVYGMLNQKDSAQYLKINKAYLGEGNALMMAGIEDSSTYYNNLNVIIEEWENNQIKRTIVFDTTSINNKESGAFYSPHQIVYKSSEKLDLTENNNIDYRLKITNKITGKIISAKTALVKNLSITIPQRNPVNPVINFTSKNPSKVKFSFPENGNCRYFQVFFRFYYTELDTVSMLFSQKSIDFNVGDAVYDDISYEIELQYLGESFFSLLNSKIPVNPNMKRKVKDGEEVELYIYAASNDFYTYLQAVKPSSGIVQEKPEFTNIENGIGIFASRNYVKSTFNLSPASFDSLCLGRYTKGLNFQQ